MLQIGKLPRLDDRKRTDVSFEILLQLTIFILETACWKKEKLTRVSTRCRQAPLVVDIFHTA